jgi:hypothetical protein
MTFKRPNKDISYRIFGYGRVSFLKKVINNILKMNKNILLGFL